MDHRNWYCRVKLPSAQKAGRLRRLRDGSTQKEFRDALPFLKAPRTWLGEMRGA